MVLGYVCDGCELLGVYPLEDLLDDHVSALKRAFSTGALTAKMDTS
jgi:hypothetical protein